MKSLMNHLFLLLAAPVLAAAAPSGVYRCEYVDPYTINPGDALNRMGCDTAKPFTVTESKTPNGQFLACCVTK